MGLDASLLRTRMREARRDLSGLDCLQAGLRVCNRVLSLQAFQDAGDVACFLSSDGEVDTRPLIEACWSAGKQVWLPVVGPRRSLAFAHYQSRTRLIENRLGISEPDPAEAAWIPTERLDCVLTPLVAFDDRCNRVGMGGGYYDRAFAFVVRRPERPPRPLLVGIAHELQRVDRLQQQTWDVPLDLVATPVRIYSRPLKQEPSPCSTG